MENQKENDGYEVPLHRSLTEPLLVMGIPRPVAILLGTLFAALVLIAHALLSIPIFGVIYYIFLKATKQDAQFFEAFRRTVNHKPFYDT